ncbi:MAG: LamG domain-containing protein [Candidatus Pacebacteria bacterium]|nr:LamG domain-containing protein [Candidatus Paceibacterota bacterium]
MSIAKKQLLFIAVGILIITSGVLITWAVNNRGAGPVAWWKLDEGQGQYVYDASGNANTGTLATSTEVTSADPTWRNEPDCKNGKCLYFDGSNDYLLATASQVNTTAGGYNTVSFWMKWNGIFAKAPFFFHSSAYYGFYFLSSTCVGFNTGQSDVYGFDSTSKNLANRWVYVTLVFYNGVYTDNNKIYIDGVSQTLSQCGGTAKSGTAESTVYVGQLGNGVNYYGGSIDDVRIYNYARSASQIKSDYVKSAGGKGATMKVGSSQEEQNASEGLVGYWKMNEASWAGVAGEVVDSSGSSNSGTSTNGANTTSTAKFGRAGYFDGTDDGVDFGTTNTFNFTSQNFTVEMWVNPAAIVSSSMLFCRGSYQADGYYLYQSAGKLYFNTFQSGAKQESAANSALTIGVWTHVAVVRNGSSVVIYLDGKDKTTTRGSHLDPVTSTRNFRVGMHSNGTSYPFSGLFDDVKVYNKARTAEQIMRDYESGPPPVGHWRMDENNGQYAYDTTGNSNNGTLGSGATADSADPAWANGKYGSALNFDGSNDYVNVGQGSALNNFTNMTLSAWIKADSYTTNYRTGIISRRSGLGDDTGLNLTLLGTNGGAQTPGKIAAYRGGGSAVTGTTTISLGKWYYIAATVENNNFKIYVNGVLDASSTLSGWTWESAVDVSIGQIAAISQYYFDGIIDDVRIYNYARTQKQVMEDMNAGHPAVGSPIGSYLGYWPLDEGYGQTVYDKSPSANNGTLASSTEVTSADPTWTTNGKFGKALSFDGTDDYVDMGDSSKLEVGTGDFSISAWIKTSMVTNASIVDKGDTTTATVTRYAMYISGGKIVLGIGDTEWLATAGNKSVNDSTWHFVTVTADRDGLGSMYVDGVLDNSGSIAARSGSLDGTGNFRIGNKSPSGSGNNPFQGFIDEVKVYPFVLSPAEVKEEYNRGAALKLGSAGGPQTATSSDAALLEYCVPGDTSYCVAPVGHWKMDEKSGQYANDVSGSGNTGTLGSGATADSYDPAWKSAAYCHSGACLSFDGTDDYVDLGNNTGSLDFTASQPFSISVWIKPTSLATTYHTIIGKNAAAAYQYNLYLNTNGSISFGVGGSTNVNTSAGAVSANNWYHIEAVSNGTTAWIYLNGAMATSGTPTSMTHQDANVYIGRFRASGSIYSFQGIIDDVRIYNYARTVSQIAYDYNRGAPVAWWQMNDGRDTATTCDAVTSVVRDSMTNSSTGQTGNPGRLVNPDASPATSTMWSEGKYGCALSFDGTDDYVNLGDTGNLNGSPGITISAWVYPKSTANQTILQRGNSATGVTNAYSLFLYATDEIRFRVSTVSTGSGTSAVLETTNSPITNLNQWYHVIGIYSDSDDTMRIYVNGVQRSSSNVSASGLLVDGADDRKIGNVVASPNIFFNGLIDDVRIYNYALTAQQIKTLYNQGSSVRFGPSSGLP